MTYVDHLIKIVQGVLYDLPLSKEDKEWAKKKAKEIKDKRDKG